jgi:glycosyltransferase involved in cell wall biosynthesis
MYNLLKRLSDRHEITLLTFIRDPREIDYHEHLPFLKKIIPVMRGKAFQPKYVIPGVFGSSSMLLTTYDNEQMRQTIERELTTGAYDLVHIEPFYVIPSLPKTMDIPLVIGEHNVEYDVYHQFALRQPPYLRPLLLRDSTRIKNEEESAWRRADHVIAVSEEDGRIISSVAGVGRVTVVTNGVDTDFFTYKGRAVPSETLQALFVGNFSWMPNVDAVRRLIADVWPDIHKDHHKATLTIIGKNLPKQIQKMLPASITYESDVPDIRTAFDASDVLLAPMGVSGGSKYKILEALAAGVPIITTKEGVLGLSVKQSVHAMVVEDSRDMNHVLGHLIAHPEETKKMTAAGRHMVESSYDWATLSNTQDTVWNACV